MTIQKLEKSFIGIGEIKGFEFNQLISTPNAYLYSVKNNGTTYYEVIVKKTSKVCLNFDTREYSDTEYKELYPKAKDFGVLAWSYGTKQRGIKKLEELDKLI